MAILPKTILMSLGAAVIAIGASAPAYAVDPPGPLTLLNDQTFQKSGEFHLYGRFDHKQVDLAHKRDVKVCVKEQRNLITTAWSGQVAMKIRTDGKTEVIRPGHCKTVDARDVILAPDGSVPYNWEVDGSVKRQG